MDQEEIAAICRTIEDRLRETIEVQPGVRVQQCQWVWGKNAGEANFINVVCSMDPELLGQPVLTALDGDHDMVDDPDQASVNSAFDSIMSGTKEDQHTTEMQEAREEALRAAEELEGDF